MMKYDFLIESYATERVKVLSVWSEFRDEDLPVRPNRTTRADAACTNRWCISASARTSGSGLCSASTSALRRCLAGDPARVHQAVRRTTAASGWRRLRGSDDSWWKDDDVLRCAALESVDHDPAPDAHVASSRPADGDVADVGTRPAQQLRPDGGHRRAHAEPRADNLCLREPGMCCSARGRE